MTNLMSQTGIGEDRLLVGLAGRGILESRTPWMHETEAEAHGLRMVYSLFDFTDRGWDDAHLPILLNAAQDIGFAGLNITFPFKQAVMAYLDDLSDAARAIGAVNTVAFQNGKRIGHNTDVTGFAAGFLEGLPHVARDAVLQLGCGGAGAATAHALLTDIGVGTLYLSDHDKDRASALVARLNELYGVGRAVLCEDAVSAAAMVDGIVNATPVGMTKLPGIPIDSAALHSRHFVADVIYFPIETQLLKEACALGCQTLDGSGMAVRQAVDAFAIFTGLAADSARMQRNFKQFQGQAFHTTPLAVAS